MVIGGRAAERGCRSRSELRWSQGTRRRSSGKRQATRRRRGVRDGRPTSWPSACYLSLRDAPSMLATTMRPQRPGVNRVHADELPSTLTLPSRGWGQLPIPKGAGVREVLLAEHRPSPQPFAKHTVAKRRCPPKGGGGSFLCRRVSSLSRRETMVPGAQRKGGVGVRGSRGRREVLSLSRRERGWG